MQRPRYRSLLKPALLTTAAALLAFGLAHAAFITWIPSPPQVPGEVPPPFLLRLLIMFVAPIGFGLPFATAAMLLGAWAWKFTDPAMPGWRYGVALATAFVPSVTLSLWHGPYGDDAPGGLGVAALLLASYLLPAVLATSFAGVRAGAVIGLAGLPLAGPWSGFLLGSGLRGWVIPFVASIFLILFGSGILMARLARRNGPFAREVASSPP